MRKAWDSELQKIYLAHEKLISNTRKSVERYFSKCDKETEEFLILLFAMYAYNGRIDYILARKYLTVAELDKFRLHATDLEWASDSYIEVLEPLLAKTRVSRIEYTQANIRSSFEEALTKSYEKIQDVFLEANKISIAKIDKLYEYGMTEEKIEKLSKEIANLKTIYGTTNTQIENIRKSMYKIIDTFTPQAFARKLSQEDFIKEMRGDIAKIKNRCRYIMYTMGNYQFNTILQYFMNELNIGEYKYCAILDNRTSEICKQLDGSTFKLTQAQVGVNFPPMHPNCRSYIIPII
jgi:SPP1 gp7 family putative phage head morphogenesis protein